MGKGNFHFLDVASKESSVYVSVTSTVFVEGLKMDWQWTYIRAVEKLCTA